LRAAGLVHRDPDLVIEAAEVFDGLTLPVEAALARAEAGDLLVATGRADDASPLFDAALHLFDTVGAQREADAVRRRLARLKPSSSRTRAPRRAVMGWEALTPTEREVVEEVCAGRSNREVAERLGVSRRTVEAHLRAVYAKVGVSTRLELAVSWQSRG
jgi:DNA-binding CsgD family transcriptional regulator